MSFNFIPLIPNETWHDLPSASGIDIRIEHLLGSAVGLRTLPCFAKAGLKMGKREFSIILDPGN